MPLFQRLHPPLPPAPLFGNESEHNEKDTPVLRFGKQTTCQNINYQQDLHVSQSVPLQTLIGEVERRARVSIDDIMSRLIRLDQAENFSNSSSDDKNEAFRADVNVLRRTNADDPISNPGNAPASQCTA